jgi:hypothetical protein
MKLLFEEIGSTCNVFDFYSGGVWLEYHQETGNALSGLHRFPPALHENVGREPRSDPTVPSKYCHVY